MKNRSGGSVIAELDQVLLLGLAARLQLEQPRRGAAEDVVLGLLGQERQVRDRRRQVEVPVRIVGGVHELGFRVHHAERHLQRLHVLNLHRLCGVVHVAHVLRRLLLQQRRFRRAQHVFVVELLHQERNPGEAGLDPQHRQLRESLAEAVDDPVRQVDDVVPGEAERVRDQEAVAALEDRLAPVRAGVERQHEAALFDGAIDLHVAVVVDREVVADGGDHEAADVLAIPERLDMTEALVRIGERQAQHREEPQKAQISRR